MRLTQWRCCHLTPNPQHGFNYQASINKLIVQPCPEGFQNTVGSTEFFNSSHFVVRLATSSTTGMCAPLSVEAETKPDPLQQTSAYRPGAVLKFARVNCDSSGREARKQRNRGQMAATQEVPPSVTRITRSSKNEKTSQPDNGRDDEIHQQWFRQGAALRSSSKQVMPARAFIRLANKKVP